MLVIVTGASKGIGFELMKQFSNSEYLVIAVSRNINPILNYIKSDHPLNILPVQADISKKNGITKIVATCKKLKKPVAILIHNAAQLIAKPFEKISEKEIQEIYQTNVFGPFLLTQSLVPFMGKTVPSHIVNISSMGGFQGSIKFAGLSVYSSSKAALANLTECLAEELKSKNISVNCLAIGAVQTKMLSKAFPGFKAPLQPKQMASYIYEFAINGNTYYNGKVLPVSSTTP